MKVKFNYTVYFAKPSWSCRRVDTHNRRGAIDRHITPNMMHHDTWIPSVLELHCENVIITTLTKTPSTPKKHPKIVTKKRKETVHFCLTFSSQIFPNNFLHSYYKIPNILFLIKFYEIIIQRYESRKEKELVHLPICSTSSWQILPEWADSIGNKPAN